MQCILQIFLEFIKKILKIQFSTCDLREISIVFLFIDVEWLESHLFLIRTWTSGSGVACLTCYAIDS